MGRTTTEAVFDELEQGKPIREGTNTCLIPSHLIEVHERVYRFRGSLPSLGLETGDLLIAEPRKTAATGELVIATLSGNAYLGNWWKKNGTRQLMLEPNKPLQGNLHILAAVNLILRENP